MHIKWPMVALVLGTGILILSGIELLTRPEPASKAADSPYYQTGVVKILSIDHVGGREAWGIRDTEVLTVQDEYSRSLYLIYLCARIPVIPTGTRAVIIYKKDTYDAGSCHELKSMSIQ